MARASRCLLIAGCGQPAVAWHLEHWCRRSWPPAIKSSPTTTGAWLRHRHRRPRTSVEQMTDDAIALLDHLGWSRTGAGGRAFPGRLDRRDHGPRSSGTSPVGRAHGKRQQAHGMGGGHHHGRAGPGRLDYDLPPLFYATETLRYLPIADIQNDEVVSTWLSFTADLPVWPNPGRLGQYEAALAWSTDPFRTTRWPEISVPCLVLAFEHDVDSPPDKARQAAGDHSRLRVPGDRWAQATSASSPMPTRWPATSSTSSLVTEIQPTAPTSRPIRSASPTPVMVRGSTERADLGGLVDRKAELQHLDGRLG